MEDLYEKGEEKFGYLSSILYQVIAKRIGSMQKFYAFIADDISKDDPRFILDVGTGPGLLLKMIAKPDREIYAVDPSYSMLALSRKNNKGVKGLHIHIGSSRMIPFNQKYDLIISTLSLHHWKEKESSLVYLSTFLKKRGEIRIYEFERLPKQPRFKISSSHGLGVSEAREIAKKAKLIVKGIRRKDGFLRITFSPTRENQKHL